MEMNEKFYDAILTEGARWLAVLHGNHGKLVVKKEWDNKPFMDMARVALSYDVEIYFQMSIWRYLYTRYIKHFIFLKRPQNSNYFEVVPSDFIKELTSFAQITPEQLNELHQKYGVYR